MSRIDRNTGKHVAVWRFLARQLPRPLIYWATVRLARETNPGLTIREAMARWAEGENGALNPPKKQSASSQPSEFDLYKAQKDAIVARQELGQALSRDEWDTILLALEFRDRDHDSLRLLPKLKRRLYG